MKQLVKKAAPYVITAAILVFGGNKILDGINIYNTKNISKKQMTTTLSQSEMDGKKKEEKKEETKVMAYHRMGVCGDCDPFVGNNLGKLTSQTGAVVITSLTLWAAVRMRRKFSAVKVESRMGGAGFQ